MLIYGVKYENYVDGLESWVDNDVYKTQEAALRTAEQTANETIRDLMEMAEDDDDVYYVRRVESNGDTRFEIVSPMGHVTEAFVIIELNLIE
jgi:hypothetical protein